MKQTTVSKFLSKNIKAFFFAGMAVFLLLHGGNALGFSGQIRAEKNNWEANEKPAFNIDSASPQTGLWEGIREYIAPSNFKNKLTVRIASPRGEKTELREGEDFEIAGSYGDQKIEIKNDLFTTPGKYQMEVVFQGEEELYSQDFIWGVLAVNANKSIYAPGEKGNLAMAVLDERGNMICGAKLELRITNQELGVDDLLSTENGKIKVNEEICNLHNFTLEPDYGAEYQFGDEGTYELALAAETQNGSYTISDKIEVKKGAPFDVERITATRIFPPEKYPVVLNISANEDFSGEIVETAPASFEISKMEKEGIKDFDEEKTEGDLKNIIWKVKIKKGEKISLGYQFDAPDISPEFYLLGPLKFIDKTLGLSFLDKEVFKEARQWQIAADAIIAQYSGGLLVYADTANAGTPKYKTFDDTGGFGSEQNATSVGSNAISWIRVAADPIYDRWIIATKDTANVIKAQVCAGVDGGVSCGSATSINSSGGAPGLRNFDVAFEGSTGGEAILVYGTSTADELRYIKYSGGSWTGDAAITTTRTSGTVEWVELVTRNNSDQIGIAYADSIDDVSAYRWSGSAVADETTAAITTAVATDVRKFDIGFENSGDMVVVVPRAGVSAGTDDAMTLSGTTWTTGLSATTPDMQLDYVDMVDNNVSGDRLGVMGHGALGVSNTEEVIDWTGSAIADSAANTLDDTTATVWAANYMSTAACYASSTYHAVFVFSQSNDDINWGTMTSAPAFVEQTDNTRSRGTMRFLKLYDYPNADKVLLLSGDANSDLWADTWDTSTTGASAWTALNSGATLEGDLASATKEVFDFAFRLAPPAKAISGTSNMRTGDTVKVAINGTVHANVGAIDAGTGNWSITVPGSDLPVGASVIVWTDTATAGNQSTAITKSSSGDISGMVLNANVLTIGSGAAASINSSNVDDFTCGSSGGGNVMHAFASSTLSVEGCSHSYTAEKIDILASNTLTISGTETLTTYDLSISASGILTSGGASAYNVSHNFTNAGTFNASSSTIIFNGAAAQSFTTNGAAYNNITLNNTGSDGADDNITITGALDVNGTFNITNGDLILTSGNPNVNTAGNVAIGANAFVTAGSGTWTFDGGTQALSDASAGQNLGIVTIGPSTTTIVNTGSAIKVTSLTLGANDTLNITDDTLTITGSGTAGSRPFIHTTGTFTVANSTVKYIGTADTTIQETTYNHLELSPAGGSTPIYTLATAGSKTITTQNLTIGNGTNAVSVTAATNNPILDVNGNLVISNGGALTGGTQNIYTAGNVTISSTASISKGSGTWTFDGTTAYQDSSGAGPQNIGLAAVTGTSLTLSSSMTADKMTVSAGALNLGSSGYTLTLAGSGAGTSRPLYMNGGTLNEGTNSTIKYTGTTASEIQSENYYHLNLSPSGGSNPTYTLLAGQLGWGDSDQGSISHDAGEDAASRAYAIARDSSGNIYAAGYTVSGTGQGNCYVAKFDSNGDLATGWGDGDSGKITYTSAAGIYDYIYAIAVDSSGNIYAAGSFGNLTEGDNFRINKYNANGDLATGWGDGDSGSITYDSGSGNYDDIYALALDDSGNIYVAGESGPFFGDANFRIHKYNSSGDLATGWGDSNSGMITYDSGGSYADKIYAIALDDSTDEIYVAGSSTTATNGTDFRIHKYTSGGDIATGWGDGDSGMITYNSDIGANDVIYAIALDDSTDEIYVAGFGDDHWFRIHKYTSGGDIATGWGDGDSGVITYYSSGGGYTDIIYAIARDSSNNIYVAGSSTTASEGLNFRIHKYDSNGDITTNWGDGDSGMRTYHSTSNYADEAKAIVLDDSADEIYVAGYSNTAAEGFNFRINKYDANGDIFAGTGSLTITAQNLTIGDGTNAVSVTAATNNPILDVNGNFQMNSGGALTVSGSAGFTVYGSWTNSGTFNANSGTVTLDGINQSLTGNTTFNNLTKQENTDNGTNSTLTIAQNSTQRIDGTLDFDGLDDSDRLYLVSSNPGTRYTFDFYNTAQSATWLNVADSNASSHNIDCTSNCVDGGNNDDEESEPHWIFSAVANITVSGSSNGSGTVYLAVNSAVQTGKTSAISGGNWSISGVSTPTAGATITAWIDNVADSAESTAVTKYSSGTTVSGMVLDVNVVTVGSNQNQSLALSDLTKYDCSNDEDVMYDPGHTTANTLLIKGGSGCSGGAQTYTAEKVDILSGDTLAISGSETLTTYDLAISGGTLSSGGASAYNVTGNWTNSGTFTASSSTVSFNAGNTGKTINSGGTGAGKNFYDVVFNNSAGGWIIQTSDMTVTHNLAITDIANSTDSWTLDAGRTLEVNGTYTIIGTETAYTKWTGSTLYINGTSQTIGPASNPKSQAEETYGTLHIGTDDAVRMWQSSAAAYTIDSGASLYSMDHNNVNGDLYIWGTYNVPTNDYWSYTRDFDNADLSGGSERQVDVRVDPSATVTVGSGDTLAAIGEASFNRTNVSRQGAANGYGIIVDTGIINFQYADFEYLDGDKGLDIRAGSTVTSLDYCKFNNLVSAGAADAFITVAASVIGTGSKILTGVQFDDIGGGAEFNVNRTGTNTGYWLFDQSTGDFDGEDYDGYEGGGDPDPGMIRWASIDASGGWNMFQGTFMFEGTNIFQ